MTFYNPLDDDLDSVEELWRLEFYAVVGSLSSG